MSRRDDALIRHREALATAQTKRLETIGTQVA